jgi:hypothetical protein
MSAPRKTIDLPFTPEQVRDGTARQDVVSFTVPASGRRYNIHLDDWASIQLHMEIANAARQQR